MANIIINEAWFNATEGYWHGDSGHYETRYSVEEKEDLKKSLVRHYGECIDDITNEEDKVIGWIFEEETEYDDSKETFIRHTYVTLHSQKPTVTTTYHYL